jgi:hypothetical protein
VVHAPPPRNLPPGQAKKIYGGHDAREYAHERKHHKNKKYIPVYGERGYPLIIIRTPDIVITRNSSGQVYFRNRDGLFYWLKNDNRYYLDERYINDVQFEEDEYQRWNGMVRPSGNYGNGSRKYERGKGQGKKGRHRNDNDDD